MHILDDLIDKIVRDIFAKMKAVPKSEVIQSKYADELELRKERLNILKSEYAKALENLNVLKSEVVKSIKGESSFSPNILSDLIAGSEKECDRLLNLCQTAEREVNKSESIFKDLSATYDELISWSEIYDKAEFARKKMIVNCLINRVEVCRGYKLKIDFNFDFGQFLNGLDAAV